MRQFLPVVDAGESESKIDLFGSEVVTYTVRKV